MKRTYTGFEGVCIAKNAGLNSSFTVRKISYGEGIERVLPLFSPQINKIELVKSGSVRRSKLYYLRKRSGKSARISEKNIFNKSDNNGDKVNKKEQQDANLKITDSVAKKNDDAKNLKANQTKKVKTTKLMIKLTSLNLSFKKLAQLLKSTFNYETSNHF